MQEIIVETFQQGRRPGQYNAHSNSEPLEPEPQMVRRHSETMPKPSLSSDQPGVSMTVNAAREEKSSLTQSQKYLNEDSPEDKPSAIEASTNDAHHLSALAGSGAKEGNSDQGISKTPTSSILTKSSSSEKPPIESLRYRSDLAALYHQSGEFEQARREYQSVENTLSRLKDMSEDGQSSNDIEVWRIASQCELAVISLHQGSYKAAEEKLMILKEKAEVKLPELSLRVLRIVRCYAISLFKQGEYQRAYEILQIELHKILEAMGMNSYKAQMQLEAPKMLTQNLLALVLAQRGEFLQALKFNEQALSQAQTDLRNSSITSTKIHADVEDDSLVSTITHTDINSPSAISKKIDQVRRRKREGTIMLNKAKILVYAGKQKEAWSAVGEAHEIMRRVLGATHPMTLECSILNARILVLKGDFNEADKHCERALQGLRKKLGDNHPLTLEALGVLVSAFTSLARLTEARNTAKYLVSQCETILGPTHPQTIQSLYELARILDLRGESIEAREHQEAALNHMVNRFKENNPQVVTYKTALASILGNLGEWEQASKLACETFISFLSYSTSQDNLKSLRIHRILDIVEDNKNQICESHPSIFTTLQYISVSERERTDDPKRIESALAILELTLEFRKKRFSNLHHPDSTATLLQLGITERKAKRLSKARVTLEGVVDTQMINLGSKHPDTLIAKRELSYTIALSDATLPAIRELRKALELQILLLGWSHPSSIQSSIHLSTVWVKAGNAVEATNLQLIVIASQIQLYYRIRILVQVPELSISGNDPTQIEALRQSMLNSLKSSESPHFTSGDEVGALNTLRGLLRPSIEQLVALYVEQSRYEEALGFQKVLTPSPRTVSPRDNLIELGALNNLAVIYQGLQKFQKSEELYQQISSITSRKETTDQNRALLCSVHTNLATLYFEIGKLDDAADMQSDLLRTLKESNDHGDRSMLVRNLFNHALTLKRLGRDEKASKQLQAAVEVDNTIRTAKDPQSLQIMATLEQWR